ncbi:MAG: iron dicitrate transport regulator FecR, partial [Nitrospiraceae bacterium]
KMKAREIIRAVILLIFMGLPSYAMAEDLSELRLSLVDGDVQIITEDTREWVPAAINMPIRGGDRIWVPEGARAELQARYGTAVRLDENSSLEILTVTHDSLQLYLSLGQVYVNFRGEKNDVVQLDTPIASVRVYDTARFNIAVAQNGDTDISAFRGAVAAESRSGKTRVGSGQMLSLGDAYADLSPLGEPDDWERWNRDRDKRYEERGYSSQYLPGELEGYASDFDNNGRWFYTRDYGYVWTPTVYVSAGWSPYRQGRWVWMGGDYVWIASEPWGWAPYHYGRWAFITSFGWCWVPPARGAAHWGPGYVGWVYTPTYVAWVPLAPQETYYGYGHYGPHSVNITTVNINNVVVKEVYRNVYVNNAVTVVNRDSFLTGRKEGFKVRENPFLRERISVGRPRIEPERATRIPVIREIPKAKEPPRRVRETEVRELKEKRHFVREPNRSVFVPQASPRTLPVRRIDAPKKGTSIRPVEPGTVPVRRMRQLETQQPKKTAPAKRQEIRQAPVESQTKQRQLPTVPQPVIKKRDVQPQQPVMEKERRIIKKEERIEQQQRETKVPAQRQEILQAPGKKKIEQPKEQPGPRPDAGKPSSKADDKKEVIRKVNPSQQQDEKEEEVREFKVPGFWPEKMKDKR